VTATVCARDFEIHVDLYGPADELVSALRERLSRHLFSEDELGVEEIVLDLCRARSWTLATAESCTGGLVAARLTSVPGSSAVFLGSVVAYADKVKERELDVDVETLERYGAVSAETAAAMAAGVRRRLHADVAVGVTGIAGPGGGTADKPVGLVHLAAARKGGDIIAERHVFPGDRDAIRRVSVLTALTMLASLAEG
jgi:PncC family amidohydrolase